MHGVGECFDKCCEFAPYWPKPLSPLGLLMRSRHVFRQNSWLKAKLKEGKHFNLWPWLVPIWPTRDLNGNKLDIFHFLRHEGNFWASCSIKCSKNTREQRKCQTIRQQTRESAHCTYLGKLALKLNCSRRATLSVCCKPFFPSWYFQHKATDFQMFSCWIS